MAHEKEAHRGGSARWRDQNVTVGIISDKPEDLRLPLYPHYFSTWCIHALHEDCWGACKYCGDLCLCLCHKYVIKD